ncbi:MAG: preprotein translocase subunit SecE [Candidatus Obscuribacterales bacterium]|nr:preprotein translocase subunit SecE [Candidatus Obscuribacterales bacterium]
MNAKTSDAGPKKKDKADFTESNSSIRSLHKFLLDTLIELRKITWPSRQQVIRETGSVIVLVTLITVAVLGFDYALAKVVFEPLDRFARQMGGGIGSHH